MSINFEDPTTWDEDLSEAEALSLGIFALNTLKYPEGSTPAQMEALDFFTEGSVEKLAALRDTKTSIVTYPQVAEPQPEGTHRDDMDPERALYECFDLWASGVWREGGAAANLDEVMEHVADLLRIPGQSVNSVQGS